MHKRLSNILRYKTVRLFLIIGPMLGSTIYCNIVMDWPSSFFSSALCAALILLFYDDMRRRKVQKQLHKSYQTYDTAIQETDSAVWDYNFQTKKFAFSDSLYDILKIKKQKNDKLYTKLMNEHMSPESKAYVESEFHKYLNHESSEVNIQLSMNDSDGNLKWILIRGKGVTDDNGQIKIVSGIFLDITNIKKQQEYIAYYADHDFVTDLPNLMKFKEMLDEELKKERKGILLLLDVDNFKSVNDTLGHACGNELLILIAGRLKEIKDEKIIVSRFGGDEFLVVVKDVDEYTKMNEYIQKVRSEISGRYVLDGKDIYISFSIGVTRYPEDGDVADTLLANADTAMYKVKDYGKNSYVYFRTDMIDEIKSKMEMEAILRQALMEDKFCLYYQPQVDAETGDIVSYESLLRLKEHSISPGIFIPIAEENGLIIDIGRWVAREAIRQFARWRDDGYGEKIIAINYSSKQLRDADYVNYLKQLLEEFDVKAEYIEIEITESIFFGNNDQTIEFLESIKREGFRIALDDFGTGYSSFSYLTYIPVNKVKLDKSINDKFLELEDTNVMNSLISLVHSLNLKVTAEGIEDWDKFMKIKNCNCDYIQGYLFSKPLSVEDVKRIYNKNLVEEVRCM